MREMLAAIAAIETLTAENIRLKGAIKEWMDGVCISQKHSERIQELQLQLELMTENYWDRAELCEGLQVKLDQVKRERDAAITDLTDAQPCFACENFRRNGGNCVGGELSVCLLPEKEQCPHGLSRSKGCNEPLTLDELREMAATGDPVWLVGMENGDGWRRINYVELLAIGYSVFGDPETWCFRTAAYGVRAFAYRHKPEEAQK